MTEPLSDYEIGCIEMMMAVDGEGHLWSSEVIKSLLATIRNLKGKARESF
jgi:hypothetical protein